jgi:hypothetical protein
MVRLAITVKVDISLTSILAIAMLAIRLLS